MATELRSLAAAMLAHQVVGTRPLDPVDSHQRARFMLAGLIFGVYYRGSSYIFSGFAEAGTSALTSEPTTALVTAGPYAVSRNPAMLIVWVFHVACALAFNSWWPLLVAAPLTYAYLTLITVPNEEEALEKQFGRRYREYKQRTPRYLIPHSWLLARVCRRVCGDDPCGKDKPESAAEEADAGDSSNAADVTGASSSAAEDAGGAGGADGGGERKTNNTKVKKVKGGAAAKETDQLREMFAANGVDMDEGGEDEEMLRALLSKFKGEPEQLERAVKNVAKMAAELAPAAAEAEQQLYTEQEAKEPGEGAEGGKEGGGPRRRSRPIRKAVLGYD